MPLRSHDSLSGNSADLAIGGVDALTPADIGAATDDHAHAVPLVRVAAGAPTGPPVDGENGTAFDSTAATGGLYGWDGAAWVKMSAIP